MSASGYVLVSDQQANRFRVFRREGSTTNPHHHRFVASLLLSTVVSDGSKAVSRALGPTFPNGLFIAMSEDRTFQLYDWKDLAQRLHTDR